MSDTLIVLPAIERASAMRCLLSMRPEVRAATLVVDNGGAEPAVPHEQVPSLGLAGRVYTGTNLGVARSWNLGRTAVIEGVDVEWLVLLSEAVVFGNPGGFDLLGALGDIYASHVSVEQVPGASTQLGWKCAALRRFALQLVGPFDDGFWPAYCEDTDYLYRMGLRGLPSPRENGTSWPFVEVQASCPQGDAHALRAGLVPPDVPARSNDRYVAKWGGPQGAEQFTHPWGLR